MAGAPRLGGLSLAAYCLLADFDPGEAYWFDRAIYSRKQQTTWPACLVRTPCPWVTCPLAEPVKTLSTAPWLGQKLASFQEPRQGVTYFPDRTQRTSRQEGFHIDTTEGGSPQTRLPEPPLRQVPCESLPGYLTSLPAVCRLCGSNCRLPLSGNAIFVPSLDRSPPCSLKAMTCKVLRLIMRKGTHARVGLKLVNFP